MAQIGFTKKEMIKLEKHKLRSKMFKVEALSGEFSWRSVVTMSKFNTMPSKPRPISRSTRRVTSKVKSAFIIVALLGSFWPFIDGGERLHHLHVVVFILRA